MADATELSLTNDYQKDVSNLDAGTELIGRPCVVYEITVTSDADGDATVNFSNSITSYDADTRLVKITTTDEQQTKQVTYPKGKPFSTGVCATANKASVDVSITYK